MPYYGICVIVYDDLSCKCGCYFAVPGVFLLQDNQSLTAIIFTAAFRQTFPIMCL